MSRIVPKLNLNKTPQLVENNSLVMAKNIRLLEDGSIGPDTSLEEIETVTGNIIHDAIYHPAVINYIDHHTFSILDFDTAIKLSKGINFDNREIDQHCFDFSSTTYNTTLVHYDYSDNDNYIKVDAGATVRLVTHNHSNPYNAIDLNYSYDSESNLLVATNGDVLGLVILKSYYESYGSDIQPAYNYLSGVGLIAFVNIPRELIGTTVTYTGWGVSPVTYMSCDYYVINPVYYINDLEEVVVQQAWTEDAYDTLVYIDQIVGLNNKIYFFKESNYIKDSTQARNLITAAYPNEVFDGDISSENQEVTFDVNEDGYITRNGVLFGDSTIARTLVPNINDRVKIFEFDEVDKTFRIVPCAWNYNGGKINGCVTINGTGECILTICEYDTNDNILVPIKHININRCNESDDESFYTQAPNIPISNLRLSSRYIKNIPAGVYQFFIRYKIHDEFYTNWFPCSKELFAGSRKITNTLQGSLKHVDLHEDSNNSFVFTIEHLYPEYCANYEQFQLGFILSNDSGIFARSWKHFDMASVSNFSIYFDYDKVDINEINIDDLLKVNYNIFNIKNITQYKNKLYIANYIESDFNNPNLQDYANNIKISFDLHRLTIATGFYLNNIPLDDDINGIYSTFGDIPVNTIYYDSVYCNITTNVTSGTEILDLGTLPDSANPSFPQYINPEIIKVYTRDGGNNSYDIIVYSPSITLENENQDTIINSVIDYVKQRILGIDSNGQFKIDIDGTVLTISHFIIQYDTYGPIETTNTYIEHQVNNNGNVYNVLIPATHYTRKKYHKHLKVNVLLKSSLLTTNYVYNEYNTLLPFTKYDFYIHYVKQNGIATNGYYIGTKEINRYCKQYKPVEYANVPSDVINEIVDVTVLQESDDIGDLCWYTSELNEYAVYIDENNHRQYFKLEEILTDDYIIVPQFNNIVCPDDYVGCFISISRYGNNVSQGYNYEYNYNSLDDKTTHKVDSLELNCLLYNINAGIKVKDSKGNILTESANYYPSSTTNPIEYLGGSGHVEFSTNGESNVDTKCWLIIDSIGKPYNKQLVKLTPFIKLTIDEPTDYLGFNDVNSPGYFCETITLIRDYCNDPTGYYVSGNDIYTRIHDGTSIKLELENHRVEYHYSNKNYIFSNFNLNYVSLTSDLTPIIRRYEVSTENDAEDGIVTSSDKQLITLVNSLLASYSLELKSFYKEYTRKLYQEYDKNKIIKFDNTIRVSNVDVDELYRYIYKFEATDYYNVPTHRGIITNLVAVANTLYVHCEHSLFKFTDNKTLNAQEENVTLQENDIFNSGISEVFDAQYGYAGLSDRRQSLVTYNAYVFYDSIAQIIYAFGGEQQVGNVSDSIKKLIDTINPTDVRFVGDETHNRFFVNLINDSGNVCLSFNFANKNFISIHDINFKFGFHSRRHTYFVHDNINPSDDNNDIIGWSIYRITDKIHTTQDNFIAYRNCYKQSLINIDDCDRYFVASELNIANACVDIIINIEYEKIKVLEYISWICSQIDNYGNNNNFVAEENLNREFPGSKIRIYTDSTNTALIDLLDANGLAKIAHNSRNMDQSGHINPNPNSWQDIQYNCGVWSMNYFRDVRNTTDVFSYKDSRNKITGGEGSSKIVDLSSKPARKNLTQENSLIYGKYVVVRFIFNNRNFKLENVIVKLNDYEKTK